MLDVTHANLLAILTEEGLEASEQTETGQIYVAFKILEREFPLFIKLCHEGELIQLLIFIPAHLNSVHLSSTARLLHLLNKHIDLPGFGIDEENQVMYYRLMLSAHEKRVTKEVFKIYVNATRSACEAFAPLIQGVNQGAIPLEDVFSQMNEKGKL